MIIARGQTSSSLLPFRSPLAVAPWVSSRFVAPFALFFFLLLLHLPPSPPLLSLPSPLVLFSPRVPYARVIITAAIRHASLATLCPGESFSPRHHDNRARIDAGESTPSERGGYPPGVSTNFSRSRRYFARRQQIHAIIKRREIRKRCLKHKSVCFRVKPYFLSVSPCYLFN